jgi:hypothetical protein
MSVNPKNTLSVDACTTPGDIEILGVPDYEIPDYILTDNKQYMKYLFAIEKECRRSFEYKQFMRFLKDNCGMDRDSFLENVTSDNGARIEIHHSPLTLFDIVSTVVNKRTEANESLSIPMVAKEVMWCHYRLMIGLIPLSKTVHELVHSQYLYIPSWAVFGYYSQFLEAYGKWLPLEVKANIASLEQMSAEWSMENAAKVLEEGLTKIKVNESGYNNDLKDLYKEANDILDELKAKEI